MVLSIQEKYNTIVAGFNSDITLDLQYRKQQLRDLYYGIKDNESLFKKALFTDLHRSPAESELLELHLIYAEINGMITNLDKWAVDESLGRFSDIRLALGSKVLRRQPFGTTLIISPWNYPLLCSIVPVATAIAAGNTVIIKPSEMVPAVTDVLAEVLSASLDKRIFQVVKGAIPETTELLKLKFDKVMLTGSTSVGKIVAKAAAEHLSSVTLELGGKSPTIVTNNADPVIAARRIIWGKFVNAGQTCVAPDYLIVESGIADRFFAAFKDELNKTYPNLNPQSDYAHIVNSRLYERAVKQLAATKGKIYVQQGTPDAKTLFFPPTLVTGIKLDDVLMEDELFNPILPAIVVDDIRDSIEIIRSYDHPLALYVFTKDTKEAHRLIDRTRSGSVMINDCIFQAGSSAVPFGGVGPSGTGRYHGKFGFDEFSHPRPVISQPYIAEPLLKGRTAPHIKSHIGQLRALSVPREWFSRRGTVRKTLIQRLLSIRGLFVLLFAVVAFRAKSRI